MRLLEKGDPVAHELIELQMSYIDNYVNWFKARGANAMAVVGGFGDRLYPAAASRAMATSSSRRSTSRCTAPSSSPSRHFSRMNYVDRRPQAVSSRIIPVQPFDYVVFGATGDLTKRKLIPALYHRFKDGQFDEQSRIIGVSRTKWTDAEFQKVARESIAEFVEKEYQDKKVIDRFVSIFSYVVNDVTDEAGWGDLEQEACATIPRSSAPSISPSRPICSGRSASTSARRSSTAATPAW